MGKLNASDKIMFENQKKIQNMEIRDIFYIKFHSKDYSEIEFTAC